MQSNSIPVESRSVVEESKEELQRGHGSRRRCVCPLLDSISHSGASILRLKLCNLDIEWFAVLQIELHVFFQKLRLKMKNK